MPDQAIVPDNTFVGYFKIILADIAASAGNDREEAKKFARNIMSLPASASEEKIKEICGEYGIFY